MYIYIYMYRVLSIQIPSWAWFLLTKFGLVKKLGTPKFCAESSLFIWTLPYIVDYFSTFRQAYCWVYMQLDHTNIHESTWVSQSISIYLAFTGDTGVDWNNPQMVRFMVANGSHMISPPSPSPAGLKKTNSTNISSIWGGGADSPRLSHFWGTFLHFFLGDFRDECPF